MGQVRRIVWSAVSQLRCEPWWCFSFCFLTFFFIFFFLIFPFSFIWSNFLLLFFYYFSFICFSFSLISRWLLDPLSSTLSHFVQHVPWMSVTAGPGFSGTRLGGRRSSAMRHTVLVGQACVCIYIYIICISNNHIYIYYMPQNISSHSSWRGQKTLWVWWFDGLVFHRKFHHTRLQRRASSRSRRSSGWSSYEARETWGSSSTISAVSHECQLVTKVFVGTVSFTLFHRDCSISMHFCDL